MQKTQLTNGIITAYSSVKELPILRYNSLNKFLAQDHGVGADLDAVSAHYAKFDSFLAAGDLDALKRERINLQYCFNAMFLDMDIRSRAFLSLVYSIQVEGEPEHIVSDLNSDEEIALCAQLLDASGCTIGDMEDTFDALRKKWIMS